ncbi:uncharacterized protein J4E78_001128 [Alternaria triticimaculans]|uniref:uncharacterized protein n=1 Tax=Alternaria triticimaculans TaxID=297637 RepID=UPI0020C1EE91|nr:uncharacterized protein J4E78_001128 [Alternaria triticimaculans]KAI4672627.1 hypothetical protein J4E78_001128 [Alternaria triticimaculans]
MELDLGLDTSEPSVLEWARAQGVCVDYETELLHIRHLQSPLDDEIDRHLHEPSDATIDTAVSGLVKEKLTVNKDTAWLLKAAHALQDELPSDLTVTNSRTWRRDLRQELPVLRSDHELDLLNFGGTVVPDFKNLQIPSEIMVEENDEGFGWPARYLDYPAQCDAQVKVEKLAISREVLVYLQDTIRDAYVPEDGQRLEAESLIRKQKPNIRPVTPPLLPVSPPLTPYIPSSPTNRLPFDSDTAESVTIEAQALQEQILAADVLFRTNSNSSDSMLFDLAHPSQFNPDFEPTSSPILKRRAEDLKVEGPLTPSMCSSSPMKRLKSVSFADESLLYKPWGEDDEGGAGSDQFFHEIEEQAERANEKIENERLSGADTIARVDIPYMDFSLPMAPWIEYSRRKGGDHRPDDTELQAQMQFLLRIKREDLRFAKSWHGLSIPERELKWGFLTTKVSTLSLEEKLHGESEVAKIVTELTTGDVATSSAQVWKREGLRILDEDEDEEDLDPEEYDERNDMEALIRKRKLEMEEEVVEKHRRRTSSQPIARPQIRSSTEMQESHHFREREPTEDQSAKTRSKRLGHASQKPQAAKQATGDLMFGGFSATTALNKFMQTRGKPVDRVESSTAKVSDSRDRNQTMTHTLPVRSRGSSSDQPVHLAQQAQTTNKPLPQLPTVPSNLAPCSFVISSTFLQQRGMLKMIESIYPSAEMVYRDYTLPHSAAKEAEIILSPSTGLIFTTLQQIKQRALPGQPDKSPVKERMLKLQLRYERLIVLVSEGLSREMEELGSSRPDDPRDTEALKAFDMFASKLEGEVLVRYVRGGEQALARFTVVEMANYGLPYGSADIGDIKPVAQETSWEVFLRRVGLNPFAAQVIMAWLRKPLHMPIAPSSTHHAKTVSAFGLARFFLMSEEERIHSFQALMGGYRVLMRASELIDQRWVSAVHGFRM